jgi:hypothetical protein
MTKMAFAFILSTVIVCAQTGRPAADRSVNQPQTTTRAATAQDLAAHETQTAESTPPPAPVVISVENANGRDKNLAHLTDRILVKVKNLSALLAPKNDQITSVILFLDNRPLPNTKAQPTGPSENGVTVLAYDLRPNYDDAKEAETWRFILISARRASPHQIPISVGLPGQPISSDQALILMTPKAGYQVAVYAFLGTLLFCVVWLARKSDLIRGGPIPEGGGPRKFSLGQTQMAIWFCLIVIGWAYISLMTISAAHLSSSVLVLMGISGTTGLAAVLVDATKTSRSAARREVEQLQGELDGVGGSAGLRRQVIDGRAALRLAQAQPTLAAPAQPVGGSSAAGAQPAVAPVPVNLASLEIQLAEKDARLKKLLAEGVTVTRQPATQKQSWISDILSDENGISFHRFQMLAWTLVLGAYFGVSIFKDYVMPEFDTQMLVLMGISSGTYLGFKLPEQAKD